MHLVVLKKPLVRLISTCAYSATALVMHSKNDVLDFIQFLLCVNLFRIVHPCFFRCVLLKGVKSLRRISSNEMMVCDAYSYRYRFLIFCLLPFWARVSRDVDESYEPDCCSQKTEYMGPVWHCCTVENFVENLFCYYVVNNKLL